MGSELPEDIPEPVEWRFDEPQPDWKPTTTSPTKLETVKMFQIDDALRLSVTDKNRPVGGGNMVGAIHIALPNWKLEEWGYVEIRARTQDPLRNVGLDFNYSDGDHAPLVADGSVQTYRLSLDRIERRWEGPWTQLGIWFNSRNDVEAEAAALDLLSVRVVPREFEFAAERVGIQTVGRGTAGSSEPPNRRSIYMHAPGRIEYRVQVPEKGRLDVGLGVLSETTPVTFAVTARTKVDAEIETLFEETYSDHHNWGQRSVDLSHLTGQTVTLSLDVAAERTGTVAIWSAPTLSGSRATDKPNIIFYIIDGAGADYMSVYGYNRQTTPYLERLAAEGVVFEQAYSNSSWTRPSTPSFLTSLHHSVLGGLRNDRNRVPDQVLTMAEHLHRAGYQTAEFTSNPNAGTMSGLDRGVDVFREAGAKLDAASSVELHENFRSWREAYPGEPYWVHFQTTDVHRPHTPIPPFAGLFISPERRRTFEAWRDAQVRPRSSILDFRSDTRVAYASAGRDLYDETMAHQDYQLGQLVTRLKAAGEWERTLLIIASDHGAAAGSQDWAILMRDVVPPNYGEHRLTPIFRSGVSRIPLIFVWPGHILPGQRFSDPVSMIDMLPTILDLADLPMPEVMQGQSLAPLLLGGKEWEPRPVILDEFKVDPATGELSGRIEVVDGRWGASLEINPKQPDDAEKVPHGDRRPAPLLLYDLWNDPMCLHSLHEERPDLVEKYTEFLEAQWKAHQLLAQRFTRSGEESPLTPEQLQTLRSLGYIR